MLRKDREFSEAVDEAVTEDLQAGRLSHDEEDRSVYEARQRAWDDHMRHLTRVMPCERTPARSKQPVTYHYTNVQAGGSTPKGPARFVEQYFDPTSAGASFGKIMFKMMRRGSPESFGAPTPSGGGGSRTRAATSF